jgi:acetyltransferase-like isoleucine patch superfamily enzyme
MHFSDVVGRARVMWYRRLWTCTDIEGTAELRAPALLAGAGSIGFENGVILGWEHSPGFFSGYTYIEARHPDSRVTIGERTHFNNGVTIISDGTSISIGKRCLVGPMVQIYDSDFHALDPARRATDTPRRAPVSIGDDVFIGASAIILKGVTVGAGSVVGAGAIVSRDVPPGTTIAQDR